MKALILVLLSSISVLIAKELEHSEFEVDKSSAKANTYGKFVHEKNYPIPTVAVLSAKLKEGIVIRFIGKIQDQPKRINIDFKSDDKPNGDLPLHISVRWDEGIFSGNMVSNIRKNGTWGTDEQRLSNPFKANGHFDLRIRIGVGKYEVFGNGALLGTFIQKAPYEDIKKLEISGDLAHLRLISTTGAVFTTSTDYVFKLTPHKRGDISLLPKGKRADVGFYNAKHDCLLQISIRFKEGAIIRNSLLKDGWGKEEREGGFPLTSNKLFDLTVVNEPYSYQILFNGKFYATYAHRAPPGEVDHLKITGDVEIQDIQMNNADGQ